MCAVEHPLPRAAVRARRDDDACDVADGLSEAALTLCESKRRVVQVRDDVGESLWRRLVDGMARLPPGGPNRAYHKLGEMLMTCVLPRPKVSVHLCEAPGGFVCATSEVADPAWTWTALSQADGPTFFDRLPPHGDARVADIFDDAPDLPADACLVTADGAVAMDHDVLEAEHLPLLVRQTVVAFSCLRPGGSLVIKFFEGSTPNTVRWAGWVSSHFEMVSVIKPTASRPTNSERYLVGRHFSPPPDRVAYDEAFVAEDWCRAFRLLADRLAREQTESLRGAFARAHQFRG